jgi:hypothetical protein
MFALAQAVSVVLLLEVIPEFIDDFEAKWFLLFNFTIGKIQIFHLILNFYNNFFLIFSSSNYCLHYDGHLFTLFGNI